ncbi:MAG: hypothetical protein HQ517_07975 [SAR324 cluster bacterium]|nr:hypothetical protein [SAR324 cluster bacterium]
MSDEQWQKIRQLESDLEQAKRKMNQLKKKQKDKIVRLKKSHLLEINT